MQRDAFGREKRTQLRVFVLDGGFGDDPDNGLIDLENSLSLCDGFLMRDKLSLGCAVCDGKRQVCHKQDQCKKG